MSDPTNADAPVAEAVTPDPEPTPDGGTSTVDYEKRYQDLRPQYDRTQSELDALRKQQEAIRNDPEAQRQFLAELGYDLADDEPEVPEFNDDDPVSALEQRLAAIEAKEQQAEQARQIAAAEAHFNKAFERLGIPEDEHDAVIGMALTMPPGDDGMPPVEEAAKKIEAMWEARQKNWAASKKTGHSFSPNGQAATEQPNLDDPQERVAWMAQRLAERNADN